MTVLAPNTPDELQATLSDDKKLAELAKTPADLAEFIRSYVKAADEKHGAVLAEQIRDQTQIAIAQILQDNQANLRRPDVTAGMSKEARDGYEPEALGAALDGEFMGMRDFLTSALPSGKRSPENRAKWERIRNDYGTVDPASGGFLVPETLRADIMTKALESSVVLPGAMDIPMDTPTVVLPTVDETTHSGSVYGGITGAWVAEGGTFSESIAQFGRVVLHANKLYSFCQAPAELPMDAPRAFGRFIERAVPAALAHFSDIAYLRGAGSGQPLGMLNANNTALIAVAKETSQTASTIVWENIVNMYSRMVPSSLGSAVWVAAIDTFPQLAEMSLDVGTGGSAIWLNNGAAGPPMTILGRPVMFTERTYSLGSQGDIAFLDRSQYGIGNLQQMRVQSSEHYAFNQDIISYRFIERKDGRPLVLSALTLANGSSNTVSPYVTLAVRS